MRYWAERFIEAQGDGSEPDRDATVRERQKQQPLTIALG
jgi:hypothetical protein